jgi:galactokinase
VVVASTLTFLVANGKLGAVTKGALVRMAMENETRVGVNSGGMDQAASVMSGPGAALYIEFFPRLHAEPVALPGTAVTAVTAGAPGTLLQYSRNLMR